MSIVHDLRLDRKLKQLDGMTGAPYLRFYCGVPITNNKDFKIGSVYVVDGVPRTEVSLEQLQFLTMMAGTVMDHLENIRIREEASRATKMSQGRHAFIEGDGTMHGDWKQLSRYNLPTGAGIGFSWKANKMAGSKHQHSPTKVVPPGDSRMSDNSGK